jgi:hypothetical protein
MNFREVSQRFGPRQSASGIALPGRSAKHEAGSRLERVEGSRRVRHPGPDVWITGPARSFDSARARKRAHTSLRMTVLCHWSETCPGASRAGRFEGNMKGRPPILWWYLFGSQPG